MHFSILYSLAVATIVAFAHPTASTDLVDTFQVPSPNVELFRVLAIGNQDYYCRSGMWVPEEISAPAKLYNATWDSVQIGALSFNATPDPDGGTHLVTLANNNTVTLQIRNERPSPYPYSLHQSLFRVTSSSLPVPVTYAQRLNTFGGSALTSMCVDERVWSAPYRFEFAFFGLPEHA